MAIDAATLQRLKNKGLIKGNYGTTNPGDNYNMAPVAPVVPSVLPSKTVTPIKPADQWDSEIDDPVMVGASASVAPVIDTGIRIAQSGPTPGGLNLAAAPAPVEEAPEPIKPVMVQESVTTTRSKTPTKAFTTAMEGYNQAIEDEKVAQRQVAERESAARIETQKEVDRLNQEEQTIRNDAMKSQELRLIAIDKQLDDVKNTKYEGFWQSKSTGDKIGAAIAMAVGAYAQGISGGAVPNTALTIINKAMDDDFLQYKANQQNKIEAIQQSRLSADQKLALTNQAIDSIRVRKIAQNDALQTKLNTLADKVKDPNAKDKIDVLNAQLEQRKQQDMMKIQNEMATETQTQIQTQLQKPSAGQEALDKDFAKDYNEWTSGGQAALDKNLQRLEKSKARITAGTSGRFRGRLPDFMRSEENIQIQQDVQAAAQGALKATLGTQFTEKEGERIMAMAYDPTLSPEVNIQKVEAAIQELKTMKRNKELKSRYFEQKGTLQGFRPLAPQPAPHGQTVVQNGATFNWNGFEYVLEGK